MSSEPRRSGNNFWESSYPNHDLKRQSTTCSEVCGCNIKRMGWLCRVSTSTAYQAKGRKFKSSAPGTACPRTHSDGIERGLTSPANNFPALMHSDAILVSLLTKSPSRMSVDLWLANSQGRNAHRKLENAYGQRKNTHSGSPTVSEKAPAVNQKTLVVSEEVRSMNRKQSARKCAEWMPHSRSLSCATARVLIRSNAFCRLLCTGCRIPCPFANSTHIDSH